MFFIALTWVLLGEGVLLSCVMNWELLVVVMIIVLLLYLLLFSIFLTGECVCSLYWDVTVGISFAGMCGGLGSCGTSFVFLVCAILSV